MKYRLHLSPTLRLTAWYTLIIMAISIMFSVVIYEQSASQFRAGFILPRDQYNDTGSRYAPLFRDDIATLLSERYETVLEQLRLRLLLINIVIIAGAATGSYFLARKTMRPVEDALEEQRRFTADASHELRTPLAAMKTEIEVNLPNEEPGVHQRILRSNLEEIEKLDRLSTSLLTLARHENSARSASLVPTDFSAVVEEAIQRLAGKISQKKIIIMPKQLNGMVSGEFNSLTDLVVILLDNAIKYSPEGATIDLHGEWSKHNFVFKVTDHGIGIPASDLPHVFRRFYRANSARTKNGTNGFGLGLSIAKQITEQHHGSIGISSVLGEGTTVSVTLSCN